MAKSARLHDHFADLTDPRKRDVTYPLINIMVIAICAVICGADDFVAIAEFGRKKRKWLAKFLDLSEGIPSHDRFNAILAAIKPAEFEKCLLSWVMALHEITEGQIVAIDGAAKKVRGDSFVAETNIHWPSESSLVRDGVRKIVTICLAICAGLDVRGWRQHSHLSAKVRRLAREIDRIASKKGPNYQERLKPKYRKLLKLSGTIVRRARKLLAEAESRDCDAVLLAELRRFLQRTEQVRETARRRVLKGEQVPNSEKLFSMFEPHTQLYKRGKAGEPVQFGRLVMIYEDTAGFIAHHHILPREATDASVVVEQTRIAQERLGGRIEEASFDRGFHSLENQIELAKILSDLCLPKPGAKQAAAQAAAATVQFRAARQRHAGIESAIGALQSGNGLKRCRDRTEIGFERYVSLGILGRNLHALGKLLIARDDADCQAACTQRQKPAA